MKKKKFANKRSFLNPKEGVAAISFNVYVEDNLDSKRSYPSLDVEASVTISDCNRQINLEFDTWRPGTEAETRKLLKARRTKLDRLKKLLDEFIASTEAAYDYVEKRLPKQQIAIKAYDKKNK